MERYPVPLVSFVGRSNSGKTTFLEKLIPVLKQKGLKIAVIKHHSHDFEIDRVGKDTYRHKKAGASTVILSSPYKIALIKDLEEELSLRDIVARYIGDADLIITEGYKKERAPKIEIFRIGKETLPLAQHDKTILAIVTDKRVSVKIPCFPMDDVEGVAEYVLSHIMRRGQERKETETL